MIPMRQDIESGYIIPYIVTGVLNEHPLTAIAYRKTKDKDKFAQFCEQMREARE